MLNSSLCKSTNKYYLENRERVLKNAKARYWRLKPEIQKYKLKYRAKNKERITHYQKITRERCLKSWEGYIPEKMQCEVCGKDIFFNKKNRLLAVHFDHKHNNHSIKTIPIIWLRSHMNNPKNRIIWEGCNFGKLCIRCNSFLPTSNRKDFIMKLNKYCRAII